MRRKKKTIVSNKFRFITFLSIVFLLITITLGSLLNIDVAYSSTYNKFYKVRVVPGDTLWNLAMEYNNSNTDIRKLVYDIKKVNNLDDSIIIPGDVIKIPAN